MNVKFRTIALLLLTLCSLLGSQQAYAIDERGYIDMEDGTGLRYSLLLPEGEGPFPVLLQYQGYGAGSDPNDNGILVVSQRWLELGFAILGVNLRGTGCSEGDFDLFEDQWIDDGVEVLDWIVEQPWANGDVAMVGLSFPGMTQMMLGPVGHPAVKALMPWSAMTDLYRDVAYPGGIYNQTFALGWTGLQKTGLQYLPNELQAGNARCLAAIAGQNNPERIVFLFGQTHPWPEHLVYERFVPEGSVEKIDVPVLITHGWQDEQISSRNTIDYEQLNQETTWHIYGNGVHGFGLGSALVRETAEKFLVHFLKGEDNGFENTPHVQIEHENAYGQPPRWVTEHPTWPVATEYAELYFTKAGTLDVQRPEETSALNYLYPLPAPSMTAALSAAEENQTYGLPILPGGAAIFSTPPLEHDLEILGPSRVDLWLSSTSLDTDVQISLTEVRPDGQEVFVQRGWLRASHRAMDMRENRATAPYHLHTLADNTLLNPGKPTLLNIEVWPVGHVFREGSSLRVRVEAPVGTTGFRQLQFNPIPAINTVHVGGDMLSRITLSVLPGGEAPVDYPVCAGLVNQPCRSSDVGQPAGSLAVPAAQAVEKAVSGAVSQNADIVKLDNQSADIHFLRAVTVEIPGASDLEAATLHIGNAAVTLEHPKEISRFEVPEQVLESGQSLEFSVELIEAVTTSRISLANLAYAEGRGRPATLFSALLIAWLLAGWLLFKRQRRLLWVLVFAGVLVACGGGGSDDAVSNPMQDTEETGNNQDEADDGQNSSDDDDDSSSDGNNDSDTGDDGGDDANDDGSTDDGDDEDDDDDTPDDVVSAFSVTAIEIVDSQGQFLNYGLK